MGFLKVLEISTDMEKHIEDQYIFIFHEIVGMSTSQAKSVFHNIFQDAKKESLEKDSSGLSENVGDFILEKESSDEKIRSIVAKKRNEGVRDQDIRWWFNMRDLERRILLKVDDVNICGLFTQLKE